MIGCTTSRAEGEWTAVHVTSAAAVLRMYPSDEPDHVPFDTARPRLRLFGGPALSRDGETVDLSPLQKALVTLVYGGRDREISRADAAWFLWEEDDHPGARQRIRQLRHSINKRADGPLLGAEGDRLVVDEAFVTSDVDDFHRCVREGELTRAGFLLSDGFGSSLSRYPTREFDDWLSARAKSLERQLRLRASAVWDQAEPAGMWERARDAAEALYMLDPDDVPTVLRVMEARARLGKLASAEAAYATYMEQDFGSEGQPDGRVVELIDRVRALDESGKSIIGGVRRLMPLIGRDEELRRAKEAVAEVVSESELRIVVVSGESGIGKTRLLTEIIKEAALEGVTCLSAQPVELEKRIPLNPIIDALEESALDTHLKALGDPWRALIGSFFPENLLDGPLNEIPPIQESSLSRRLLDAFWLLFDRMASVEPTLLFIDDLQWADATTLSVLQFVERRWDGGPLGIIVAVRPDAGEEDHALESFLNSAVGDHVRHIELRELDRDSARRLVMEVTENALDESEADKLCMMAADHPFYLTELASDRVDGPMTMPRLPNETIQVPRPVQEIIEGRLRRLSHGARKVADILAVFARSVSVADVARHSRQSMWETMEALEQLEEAKAVRVHLGQVRMIHELLRSAVYRSMTASKKCVLHGMVANAITSGGLTHHRGELAVHCAMAGDRRSAARYAAIAGKDALDTGAVAEAAAMFELAAECEDDLDERASRLGDLATAHYLGRRTVRAKRALAEAAGQLRVAGDTGRALRMEIRMVDCAWTLSQVPPDMLLAQLFDLSNEARREHDWGALAAALDMELRIGHQIGDRRGVKKTLEEMASLRIYGGRSAAAICDAGLAVGVLYSDPKPALKAALRAVRGSKGLSGSERLNALFRLQGVLITLGMCALPRSERYVREARILADTSGDLLVKYGVQTNIGVAALDAGQLDEAEAALLVDSDPVDADIPSRRLGRYLSIGELRLVQRDFERAEAAFETAKSCLSSNSRKAFRDSVLSGLGLCSLEMGAIAAAREYEARLSNTPPPSDLDPYLTLWFQARTLESRRQRTDAIELLVERQKEFQGHMTLAWLKLRILETRLAAKTEQGVSRQRVTEALQVAKGLRLTRRAQELNALLDR